MGLNIKIPTLREPKEGEKVGFTMPSDTFLEKVARGIEARAPRHGVLAVTDFQFRSNAIDPKSIRCKNTRSRKAVTDAVLKARATHIPDIGDLSADNSKVKPYDIPQGEPILKATSVLPSPAKTKTIKRAKKQKGYAALTKKGA